MLENLNEEYSFDDLLILPNKSDLPNISDNVNPQTMVGKHPLYIPIVSSPMTTVTDLAMQGAMLKFGGLGVHHRYSSRNLTFEQKLSWFLPRAIHGPVAVSPSLGIHFMGSLIMELATQYAMERDRQTFVIDVAHGHRAEVLNFAKDLKRYGVSVWSGNIVTAEAAHEYKSILDPNTDALRVGIGAGASCTTRLVSGCGRPQASAIDEVFQYTTHHAPGLSIVADGGIKSSGNIVKALALGADAVMVGGLLAGTDEAASEMLYDNHDVPYKSYAGMASEEVLRAAGKTLRVEGVSGKVPYVGGLEDLLIKLYREIQTGLAYVGARNIIELRERAKFVRQTSVGVLEGLPRI